MTNPAAKAARKFFAWNTKASQGLETRFGWQSDKPFWADFENRVAQAAAASNPGDVVVDLGGGRRCVWVAAVPAGTHVIAVDIDADELAANEVVADRRVGDVSKRLPLADNEADLIVSRALLEHVDGVEAAFAEMGRVIKPGGRVLHFVPARNSLFGIAARLGPFKLLKKLVHLAIPSAKGQVEFPVFYDQGTAKQMRQLLEKAGFSDIKVEVCYSQSGYFHPVLPVYLLVAAYQGLIRKLGLRQLAAYLIIDARK